MLLAGEREKFLVPLASSLRLFADYFRMMNGSEGPGHALPSFIFATFSSSAFFDSIDILRTRSRIPSKKDLFGLRIELSFRNVSRGFFNGLC